MAGSLAAGIAAGISLGTLCMGGMLGPSSVSRIPERKRMKGEWELAGQLFFPSPTPRPPVTYPLLPCGKQNADKAGRACAGQPECHRGAAVVWGLQSVTPTLPPRATIIQLKGPGSKVSGVKILLPRAEPSLGSSLPLGAFCGVWPKLWAAFSNSSGGEPTPGNFLPSLPCAGWTAPLPAARKGRRGHGGGCYM